MTKKQPTNRLLKLYDKYVLELLAGFLLAFLPLYPKWPLFDILPGYIVRIRLEDFVISFCLTIFLIQVVRGKAKLKQNPLFRPIVIYLIIGFISSLSAVFLTQTVPAEPLHVGKLFLHWARRVEYMSLAFIFFAAASSRQAIKRILIIFLITGALASVYGLGQKYLQWPVYSTMNREFSKGWRLVLTEHARVSSTFAGHYDFAAFNVVVLSFLASLFILIKKKFKPLVLMVFVLIFANLLLTASRTSFVAYLASMTLVPLALIRYTGFKKAFFSWIFIIIISLAGFRSFGTLYERFAHVLMLDRLELLVSQTMSSLNSAPSKAITLPNNLSLVYTPTDTPPSRPTPPPKTDGTLPPDVYEDIPLSFPEASLSAIPITSGTGTEGQSRTYSDSAFRYGLSSAIRFDALWPRALDGFKKNPLLGSGYSTLLKIQVSDFTEAESTDNDYLRALGETGLLGFISFFGIFAYMIYLVVKKMLKNTNSLDVMLYSGFVAAVAGLLINALYIDIFVASKVAYTIWPLMGLVAGALVNIKKSQRGQR